MRLSLVRSLFGLAVAVPFTFYAQSNRAQHTPSMSDEAKTLARQILLHRFLQCGTSLYIYGWIDYDTHDGVVKTGLYLPSGLKERLTHDEKQDFDKTGVSVWFSESRGLLEALVVHDASSLLLTADRLNGLRWSGAAIADSKLAASRYRSWKNGKAPPVGKEEMPLPSHGGWGEWDTKWLPAGFRVDLRKRNDNWFAELDGKPETPVGQILATPQPSCADLPIH